MNKKYKIDDFEFSLSTKFVGEQQIPYAKCTLQHKHEDIKIEYICDFGLSEKTCLLQAITEAYRRLIKTYFEG